MIPVHGGNVEEIAAAIGRDVGDVVDFSANVNPLGMPDAVKRALAAIASDPTSVERYPDPRYQDLRAALSVRLGIESDCIAIGNGSAALIDAAIRALRPRRCLLPVPAFSEYRKALELNGVDVVVFPLDPAREFELDLESCVRAAEQRECDLCIIVNPHNPSGALIRNGDLLNLIERLAGVGCVVLVDEAFIDYVPGQSIVKATAVSRTAIVLRSLTKFFAIPGMRIGYAAATATNARAVQAALPSWPVGTIEAQAVIAALDDANYVQRTLSFNARARSEMQRGFHDLGLQAFPSHANFVLVDIRPLSESADALREHLIEYEGIAVRSCSDYDILGDLYVRVAVKSGTDNRRLLDALAKMKRARERRIVG